MTRLAPYPNVELQWFKVCKHVFDRREAWWDVYGDLMSWNAAWHRLRAAGCVEGAPDGHLRAHNAPEVRELLDRHHLEWLEAAGEAVDEARAAGQVYPDAPDTACYVGRHGVTVYLASERYLKTCFRPVDSVRAGRGPGSAEARSRRIERAAVRRAARRASLDSTAAATRPSEEGSR